MPTFVIGDLLTGRRIQTLPVLSGSWSDVLNGTGEVSATVWLRNPDVKRLGLAQSATVGKAFLAVVEDGIVLQAGPIWVHEYDQPSAKLTLRALGMWSYFDHRVLLPVLAGRLPSDPTTDSVYAAMSLQAIARALVEQAQSWTSGNVPVVLPAAEPGTAERTYRGADLAPIGERLRELTKVENGPDIRFIPRLTVDLLGIEWVMQIGTPAQPLIYSSLDPVFTVGVANSSVSDLRLNVDGQNLASYAYGSGGRATDKVLTSVSSSPTLTGAGYPLLETVDSARATVTQLSTLQAYSDELVRRGRAPVQTWSFTHDLNSNPSVGGFAVGDFAQVRVSGDPYILDGSYRLRITSRSGNHLGKKVALTFQPEVI